jgi:hypothetical protein
MSMADIIQELPKLTPEQAPNLIVTDRFKTSQSGSNQNRPLRGG